MLKKISPFRLILYSFISWFLAYLIIPATYIVNGDRFFPLFVFIGYNLCLVLGFLSIKTTKKEKLIPTKIDFLSIKIAFYIGIVGFVLQIIQLVFIQKIFESNIYELRVSKQFTEFNSGGLGVIIALTFPFAIVAFLSIFYYHKWSNLRMKIMSSLFALLYIIDAYLNGARLPIAVIGVMSIIVFFIYQAQRGTLFNAVTKIKLGKINLISFPRVLISKKGLFFFIVLFLCVGFFKKAMITRLEYYNYTDVLTYWEGRHESKMDLDFKQTTNALPLKEKNEKIAAYSLYHYFTHAPFEFQKLVNHLDAPYGTFYGKYELDVYFKFLRFLNIPVESKIEMDKKLYHPGYYTTLWGPFYLDFGIFGFIIIFFIGLLIRQIYNLVIREYLPAILMYSYIAIILLSSFHVSLVGGKYIYIFNATLVFWLLNATLKAVVKRTSP